MPYGEGSESNQKLQEGWSRLQTEWWKNSGLPTAGTGRTSSILKRLPISGKVFGISYSISGPLILKPLRNKNQNCFNLPARYIIFLHLFLKSKEMLRQITKYRKDIDLCLREFFVRKATDLERVNRWGRDLITRLERFTLNGKMLRGGISLLSYEMYSDGISDEMVKVASALELIHSSLLIHDDIMDRDELRRGRKTIFYQYREMAEKYTGTDSLHIGESFGICAGDIGFYLAFEILSESDIPASFKEKVFTLLSRELSYVGIAQIQDVFFSIPGTIQTEDEILRLYLYKTARYTFSIPFITGAIIAGKGDETITALNDLGENLGILFQIRDDEIGLFGNEEVTGKPVGSDIREGKKTLYIHYLIEKTEGEDRKILEKILAGKDTTPSALNQLHRLADKSGVAVLIKNIFDSYKSRSLRAIKNLDVKDKYRRMLYELVDFVVNRRK